MKILFLPFLILLQLSSPAASPAAFAQDATGAFRQKMTETYGQDYLTMMMKSRCDSLNSSIAHLDSFSMSENGKCKASVRHLFTLLDAKKMNAFQTKALAFSKDPKVWAWIQYMEHEIVKAWAMQSFFTVWGHTYKYVNHDRGLALAYLAVTLQYTGGKDSFPELLEKNAPAEVFHDYEKLSTFLLPNSPYEWPKLARFPKTMPDFFHLQKYMYHFYAPAYLAYLLFDQGETARWSYFAPFLMDYEYEMYNQLGIDLVDLGKWFKNPTLHSNNAKAENAYRAQKIYLGYAGALFGLGKEKGIATPAEFQHLFETKTARNLLLDLEKGKLN